MENKKYTEEEDQIIASGGVPSGRTRNAANLRRLRMKASSPRTTHHTLLAKMRRKAGMSQAELSKKSKVSLRTIKAYECEGRDIHKASVDILGRLAHGIGCKIQEII